jgi:chemotaxis protein CheZ
MDERTPTGPMPEHSVRSLIERLRVILAQAPTLDPDLVEDVVQAVLDTIGGRLSITETRLLIEISELGRIIATTKADVADINASQINVSEITGSHLPAATDELDAIIEHTARATDKILECCEELDRLAVLPTTVAGPQLAQLTTKIYEACGFHDIVGQRITKIVKALKRIEAKVREMSNNIEAQERVAGWGALPASHMSGDDHLLNGPQAPGTALVQADIDELMADFD